MIASCNPRKPSFVDNFLVFFSGNVRELEYLLLLRFERGVIEMYVKTKNVNNTESHSNGNLLLYIGE